MALAQMIRCSASRSGRRAAGVTYRSGRSRLDGGGQVQGSAKCLRPQCCGLRSPLSSVRLPAQARASGTRPSSTPGPAIAQSNQTASNRRVAAAHPPCRLFSALRARWPVTRRAQISLFGQPQPCCAIVHLPARGDLSCSRLLAIRKLRLLASVAALPGRGDATDPACRGHPHPQHPVCAAVCGPVPHEHPGKPGGSPACVTPAGRSRRGLEPHTMCLRWPAMHRAGLVPGLRRWRRGIGRGPATRSPRCSARVRCLRRCWTWPAPVTGWVICRR